MIGTPDLGHDRSAIGAHIPRPYRVASAAMPSATHLPSTGVATHETSPGDRIAHASAVPGDLAAARATVARVGTTRVPHGAHGPRGQQRAQADASASAGPIVHHADGGGIPLITTLQAASAIARGEHQIDRFDGTLLAYPSQNLRDVESADPSKPGQTHVLARHVGSDLAANIARLRAEPKIRAAGSYNDVASAQFATDATIANAANQQFLAHFLEDGSRVKDALYRVDLGRVVGTSTLRRDLLAGHPTLRPSTTADIVVIKDASFPEGYRVLTSYPDATRGAEVDAAGRHL